MKEERVLVEGKEPNKNLYNSDLAPLTGEKKN